jgi:ribosome biogenesis GTPase
MTAGHRFLRRARVESGLLASGIVTYHDGPRFWVGVDEKAVPCVLRGRLRKEQLRVSSRVVVGDEVTVELLPDGTGAIEALRPRRSELVRPGFGGLAHVMAANVDQLVIVQAAHQPAFKRHLVERFLATARRGRMGALVVVNKCDLEREVVIQSWVAPLAASDVPVVLTSAVDGRGIDELRALLQGRISVLAGQSGVGKSSLLNAMYPQFEIRTAAVSAWSSKGRHTTTTSRLYALPDGGYLADTPGIRELGLFEDSEEAVTGVFPEILAAADGCKFADCTHSHEPKCAVKAAVERGEIDPDRYEHYLRLVRGN